MILKAFKPSIKELAPFIEEAIAQGKDVRLTVTGYSMYPLLRSGTDDVVLKKHDELKKYDVVLFKRKDGSYIFHRIIKIKDNVLTIAGDNETIKEYPVQFESVIAVMKCFYRSGKLHTTDELWYRFYSGFWLFIFPLRHIAAKMFHNTAKFMRKIKGAFCHKKSK
ncbi:MAG: S24/S26 family peptidase [Clostridia bacterium]|nr:S24/S26 family peptidase [Clostridia bacterium]